MTTLPKGVSVGMLANEDMAASPLDEAAGARDGPLSSARSRFEAIGALAACRIHATVSGGGTGDGLVDGTAANAEDVVDGYARGPRPPEG